MKITLKGIKKAKIKTLKDYLKKLYEKKNKINKINLIWEEKDLKHDDWVYTPDEIYGSGGNKHNIFQYDKRINYSLHFGHRIRWYKIYINENSLKLDNSKANI